MANPKFTDSDGSDAYTWAVWPHVPGDRPDYTNRMREDNSVIEYQRNDMVLGRAVIRQVGTWRFVWRNINQAMVENLRHFYEENYFRYFPNGRGGLYWLVYMTGEFRPIARHAEVFDLTVTLKEYGNGLESSSSLSSSSLSISSSSFSSSLSSTSLSSSSWSSSSSISSSSISSVSSSMSMDLVSCNQTTPRRIYIHSGITAVQKVSFDASLKPTGLAYDGANLLDCETSTDKIRVHSGLTSTISSDFAAGGNAYGLAWDGDNVMNGVATLPGDVFVHSGKTATVLLSFGTPDQPYGLTYIAGDVYSCGSGAKIFQYSGKSAVILNSFASPGAAPTGLAYTGENLLSCDSAANKIYVHSGVGATITRSFASPDDWPFGLTVTR